MVTQGDPSNVRMGYFLGAAPFIIYFFYLIHLTRFSIHQYDYSLFFLDLAMIIVVIDLKEF